MSRLWTLVPLLLLRCSAPEHRAILVFPSQPLMEATTKVQLAVHPVDDEADPCAKLAREEQVSTSPVLDQTEPFPLSGSSIRVGKLDDGRYAFVATGFNRSGERFLIGCKLTSISASDDPKEIRIELAEFRGGCTADAACYDGSPATKGTGICKEGLATCTDGFLESCAGQQLPLAETCNGEDDDCNGLVDDGVCDVDAGPPDVGPPADGNLDSAIDSTTDGPVPDQPIPCPTAGFECLSDGTARECVGGVWQSLGSCPLGCDVGSSECRVPSNVDADQMGKGTGTLDLTGTGTPVTVNTDTGAITGPSSTIIRPPGTGLDAASGIHYAQSAQSGTGVPGLGVFSMDKLTIPDGTTVVGVGTRALVLLADTVTIDGIIDITGAEKVPGPGGFAGGDGDATGQGPGGGGTTTGSTTGHLCIGGAGGGGHGGLGGAGGSSTCSAPDNFAAGGAGATAGYAALIPLAGGSGGAGGVSPTGGTGSVPGGGGGGGGALQVTAGTAVVVGPKGGVNAGGGGGGKSVSAGGAGGGAGGAILLEAPTVTVSTGAVLAANGGGGGGGDCT